MSGLSADVLMLGQALTDCIRTCQRESAAADQADDSGQQHTVLVVASCVNGAV